MNNKSRSPRQIIQQKLATISMLAKNTYTGYTHQALAELIRDIVKEYPEVDTNRLYISINKLNIIQSHLNDIKLDQAKEAKRLFRLIEIAKEREVARKKLSDNIEANPYG